MLTSRRGFLESSALGLLALGCGSGGGNPQDGGAPVDAAPDAPVDAGPPPWWLEGNFAPVRDEIDSDRLEVVGAIPPELEGAYVRNGPNPHTGRSTHWFLGDGMLHAVYLSGGRATRYRNRYVDTPLYREMPFSRTIVPDRRDTQANTSLVVHAGRVLALYEATLPMAVRADLSTVGIHDFAGMLQRPMCAHPKVDAATQEMVFHSAFPIAPYLTLHHVDARGALVRSREVPVHGPSMMHDFQLTERRAVFMDLPVVFDFALVGRVAMPYRWRDDYPARIGAVPREGSGAPVWIPVEPGYAFHTLNAYDDGDRVVLEGCRTGRIWADGSTQLVHPTHLHRWTLDLAARTVREERLSDAMVEFPQVAPSVRGRQHRYGYAMEFSLARDPAGPARQSAYAKFDRAANRWERHDLGPNAEVGEPLFVPRPDARAEDDGWVMGFVYDRAEARSELVILEAQRIAAPPVARVRMPRRVPHGFHGAWVPSARV